MTTGHIDVHSHLLPGIDDGCKNVAESVACAKLMVQAGYTHSFCTPHVWPNLPHNRPEDITRRVARLQSSLSEAGVPLKLFPGGELNMRPDTPETPPDERVVVGEQHRNPAGSGTSCSGVCHRGTTSDTRVPPAAGLEIVTRPPTSSARSRIATRPSPRGPAPGLRPDP